MSEDEHQACLTIGQLADRTGVPVRTVRYWSDVGVLTPERRSGGGYRLYGAEAVARLELVRTLRELGLGLEEVSRVVRREAPVAEIAAAHVAALDARIRALKVSRAVLSTVAERGSTAEETALMNKLARLSVAQRRNIIEDFMLEVSEGVDGGPELAERLRRSPVELPDSPTPEQVDAWLQLAELMQDPDFRSRMRKMLELNVKGSPGGSIWFTRHVVNVVSEAREDGVDPDGPDASEVLTDLFGDADRAGILQGLDAGLEAGADRYAELLRSVRGHEPQPSRAPDYEWLGRALRAELRRE
ncbi:MerR family transcriptional regulator [Streptomyces abyssalis]|uniref:MerR family transcriptional regulator n=1 Tax=Streptomyces abyssalis TaxID=933944 RepID=A0A1E7JS01_9ACTN|nr:MerR family transcriptional regulator [Streptomyces abyssalis]OEU91627.1 MerR family transcriptional regulator [Streptomyces abyssalis]OEU94236.1 MerR family transcriptional regulator [Streptomyces abyssalis]